MWGICFLCFVLSRQLGSAAVLVVVFFTRRRLSYPWSMEFVRVLSDVKSDRLWVSLAIEWHEFLVAGIYFFLFLSMFLSN